MEEREAWMKRRVEDQRAGEGKENAAHARLQRRVEELKEEDEEEEEKKRRRR